MVCPFKNWTFPLAFSVGACLLYQESCLGRILAMEKETREASSKNVSSSMPNMTGLPGCWTMDMNEGSSASYLALIVSLKGCFSGPAVKFLMNLEKSAGCWQCSQPNRTSGLKE